MKEAIKEIVKEVVKVIKNMKTSLLNNYENLEKLKEIIGRLKIEDCSYCMSTKN